MVNSPWKKRCAPFASEQHQIYPHHYELCQWQKSKQPHFAYLIYRWCVALQFLIIAICSILKENPKQKLEHSYSKWFIYLTNWGYLVCLFQSVLALFIVQFSRFDKYRDEKSEVPRHYHIYSIIHVMAIDAAISITLVYWTVVYNPEIHNLDATNLLLHVGNTIVMVVDLWIVMHPCPLMNFMYPGIMAICYSLFSFIYYSCGGTDKDGNPYIYAAMDWRTPGKSMIFVVVCLTTLALVHCFVWSMVKLRCWIARTRKSHTPLPIPSLTLSLQEKPIMIDVCDEHQ